MVWAALADVVLVIDNQKYEDEGEAEERERKTWEWLVADELKEPNVKTAGSREL